jgi:hypothetical protein
MVRDGRRLGLWQPNNRVSSAGYRWHRCANDGRRHRPADERTIIDLAGRGVEPLMTLGDYRCLRAHDPLPAQ